MTSISEGGPTDFADEYDEDTLEMVLSPQDVLALAQAGEEALAAARQDSAPDQFKLKPGKILSPLASPPSGLRRVDPAALYAGVDAGAIDFVPEATFATPSLVWATPSRVGSDHSSKPAARAPKPMPKAAAEPAAAPLPALISPVHGSVATPTATTPTATAPPAPAVAPRAAFVSPAPVTPATAPVAPVATPLMPAGAQPRQASRWPMARIVIPLGIAAALIAWGTAAHRPTHKRMFVPVSSVVAAQPDAMNNLYSTPSAPPAPTETNGSTSAGTADAVDPGNEPVRIRNPFDHSEVFEFPPGTSKADARQHVADVLMQRAQERHIPLKKH